MTKFKYTFFNSNPPVVSDRVRKILRNKEDAKNFVKAIRKEREGKIGIFKTKNNIEE
jgi:hypothetical protein